MSPTDLITNLLAPHFSPTDGEMRGMLESLRRVSFGRGEPIYRPGDVVRDICLMETGMVRAFYVHGDREVNLRLLSAPSVAASMPSLITGEGADEWVSAITPVVGYRADLSFLERHAPKLSDRLRRVMAEQHYLSLERRLRMLQHKSVTERYAYFCAHMEPDIVQNTPGYHVASYLGLRPETLSRVRRNGRS
ncbi:MAG: Crp/Fnr family transcriptional regulator [Myxococcota bacterium]